MIEKADIKVNLKHMVKVDNTLTLRSFYYIIILENVIEYIHDFNLFYINLYLKDNIILFL